MSSHVKFGVALAYNDQYLKKPNTNCNHCIELAQNLNIITYLCLHILPEDVRYIYLYVIQLDRICLLSNISFNVQNSES